MYIKIKLVRILRNTPVEIFTDTRIPIPTTKMRICCVGQLSELLLNLAIEMQFFFLYKIAFLLNKHLPYA